MVVFTEKYLEDLDVDPKVALYRICSDFINKTQHSKTTDVCLEFYALVEVLITANDLEYKIPNLTAEEDKNDKARAIIDFAKGMQKLLAPYVRDDKEQRKIEQYRKEFRARFPGSFSYEFTDGDISRIQNLLNELRQLISNSNLFEEKHRRRLLLRFEKLQSELHKTTSDLDNFWGLVGDAGVAIGKFGKNAKPFVDRIKEITDIVWRTQSRAEELPSNSEPPALLEPGE